MSVYRNGYLLVNKIHLYIWRNTVARKIKSIVCHFGESYGTTAEIVQNTAVDIYRKYSLEKNNSNNTPYYVMI